MKVHGLAFAAFCLAAACARAQEDQPPPYEKGPVWVFSEVRTKDGHFDDYMKWLDTDLKPETEALKREGYVLDYKIFVVDAPRQNEANIWVAREFPNMAAFDHSVAADYAMFKRAEGPAVEVNTRKAARGSIRDILSEFTVREVMLK
jgi:hypothetical protein